jgi:hypothetical protein
MCTHVADWRIVDWIKGFPVGVLLTLTGVLHLDEGHERDAFLGSSLIAVVSVVLGSLLDLPRYSPLLADWGWHLAIVIPFLCGGAWLARKRVISKSMTRQVLADRGVSGGCFALFDKRSRLFQIVLSE